MSVGPWALQVSAKLSGGMPANPQRRQRLLQLRKLLKAVLGMRHGASCVLLEQAVGRLCPQLLDLMTEAEQSLPIVALPERFSAADDVHEWLRTGLIVLKQPVAAAEDILQFIDYCV